MDDSEKGSDEQFKLVRVPKWVSDKYIKISRLDGASESRIKNLRKISTNLVTKEELQKLKDNLEKYDKGLNNSGKSPVRKINKISSSKSPARKVNKNKHDKNKTRKVNMNPAYGIKEINRQRRQGKFGYGILCFGEFLKSPKDKRLYDKAHFSDSKKEVKILEKLVKSNRNFLLGWYNMGHTKLYLGKLRESINCFNEILKTNPKDIPSLFYKGEALERAGEYAQAIITFSECLKFKLYYQDAAEIKEKVNVLKKRIKYQK